MTDAEKREAARMFFYRWKDRGKEDEDDRSYWIDILQDLMGLDHVTEKIEFQKKVVGPNGNMKKIDAYIPATKVLIEQKSLNIALDKPQSGHDGMTPFEQAKMYDNSLPHSEKSKWIILSNFKEIWIYDMDEARPEPLIIDIANLQSQYTLLEDVLIAKEKKTLTKEMELSLQAGDYVGEIYDALLKQYANPEDKETQRHLNVLCVRLVFCLYAEDAGLFGDRTAFSGLLEGYEPKDIRGVLISLFEVLDAPIDNRDPYLNDELLSFPYVNGGLFKEDNIIIPKITQEIKDTLMEAAKFDWSEISPTIFGAVFESTLNPETRRSGGMHYTSIENIHKVIDPLFLDDLKAEFEEIKKIPVEKTRKKRLEDFQLKLAGLKFLDPAAGSGNFLTETYVSLRRLENQVLKEITGGQMMLADMNNTPIRVNISQFYGIEINDFAVTVAKTALWIAESQMMKETEDIIHTDLDFLPLKTNAYIVEANSLGLDWEEVVPKHELSYIIGNPPFIGSSIMKQGSEQKQDVQRVFAHLEKNEIQDLDYVCCWYKLAANYIQNTNIEVCFVSTNSICQGSQVPILWKDLFENNKIHINYAYPTFIWNSESSNQAAVHCVIISFALNQRKIKKIFVNKDKVKEVYNISPYLIEGDDTCVLPQKNTISDVPKMNFGNQPRDGGFLVVKEDEYNDLLLKEPDIIKWLKEYIGAEEFIKNKKRWCIWLKGASPTDIKNSKILYEKVAQVKEFRENSSAKTTNGYAKVPHLFAQITQPDDVPFLLIPRVSSERRRYVPIGFMPDNVIASDAVQIIPNASKYHFGVITSNVHMAWMRTIAGRLKSDYRYSKEVVYNTFPWPTPTDEQKAKIEQTAQAILDARALYPDSSLADLYDPLTMPPELTKAHQLNDAAVMRAYGFSVKDTTEADCVAELMKMYQELTK